MNIPLTPMRFMERTAKLHGPKTAIVCEDMRFTYAHYARRTGQLANALTSLGIHRGDRVSYLGYNCHRLLECFYGIPMIGGIALPLNIRLAPQDFRYILNESEPRVLFVHPELLSKIEPIRREIASVEHFILLESASGAPGWTEGTYEELLAASPFTPPYRRGEYPFLEDDIAEIFYTSGTTGNPKGVMLTHRNLYLHAVEAMAAMPVRETDVQLHLIPLFHVNGWGTPHYLTAKGGTHIILKKFDPVSALELIQGERVTRFFIVPAMANDILAAPRLGDYDVSSVKDILIGGAPPPSGMCERTEEAFRNATVHGGFGMTETCPLIAYPELPSDLAADVLRHRAHDTWGFPLVGVEFRVVDQEGNDLPWDGKSVGELLVRGDMVMKGYYRKPEETEETLKDGWYHSGDLVAMEPDGSLIIKDRLKDIIISGGENISSLEIEQVLYSNPDILECAVVAKPDQRWGEIPKAFVVPRHGKHLASEEVIAFARERLAHFKAPREVEIMAELPKGGTGKILKSVLRAKARGMQ
jgi:fatty-acyl-CoA synthase